VLRRPAAPGDRFPGGQEIGLSTGGPVSGPAARLPRPGGPAAYPAASRRARSALGVTVYIIPAAHASPYRLLPPRCGVEEAKALTRALIHRPSAERAAILAEQTRYLAWQRHEALHPAGVVLGGVTAKSFEIAGAATFDDIDQIGMLNTSAGYPGGSVTDGVVPDKVASVSLRYHNGQIVNAKVAHNVFLLIPPRHRWSVQAIIWRSRDGSVIKTLSSTALTG
jgi:hypothetical protein